MGFSQASLLSKIGLGLCVAGLIFDLIGFPSPGWATFTINSVKFSVGLFQICAYSSGSLECIQIPGVIPDWYDAVRALSIVGFLLGLACVVVLCIYLLVMNGLKLLQISALVLAFLSAIFILTGRSFMLTSGNTDISAGRLLSQLSGRCCS
ncbi:uncharacterized protein LOC124134534 [Haliotis rufescens]|uniref:uncharacterized protein LOC124134534 n=1 Tax=Haliotis rufescens TaxID=6454 RepID=UPI00201F0BF4|nr:uncharacterized protein LOC124134534 [Haliotis rufescens]